MGHHQLDSLDEQILKLIADNARIPFLEVARACNVSGAAIHQRIQKLTNLGILKGSEFVMNPEKVGCEDAAYIGLYLKDPEQFDAVTEGLKQIPEVVECHFTTGQYDMFIKIYAKKQPSPAGHHSRQAPAAWTFPLGNNYFFPRSHQAPDADHESGG